MSARLMRFAWRAAWCAGLSLLALQLTFALQILLWRWVDPTTTAFERADWRTYGHTIRRTPVPAQALPDSLRRAVIASEDARFFEHDGVDWEALKAAWSHNQTTAQGKAAATSPKRLRIKGGSTLTQQLSKNLFLSGERSYARKAQELALTWMMEWLWDKPRILDVYLNSVEFGAGIFGAEAAAQRYWGIHARQLTAAQAARLAVLLPNPKLFENRSGSAYLQRRTSTILARMQDVDLP